MEGLDSSMADNCECWILDLQPKAILNMVEVVRSIVYGLNVCVTFVSITYIGGIPFVLAGW